MSESMLSWTRNGRHSTTIIGGRTLSDTTLEGLTRQYETLRSKASAIAGREVSHREMQRGITKPPVPMDARFDANLKQVMTTKANTVEPTPEQVRLDAARRRHDEERRAGMTPVQRELEDVQSAADAADQRKADEVKRAEIMGTASYRSLRGNLDDLLFAASFDAGVSAAELEALQSQSDSLEQTLDIASIRSNVSQLQQVIAGRLDLEATNLKTAADALAARRAMLSAGQTFDGIDTEIVGDMTFVVLSVGGKTVKVSQSRYDARTSDEALRNSLFPAAGGGSNV